jgi:molybdopterin synthase catalytic subunit
VTTTAIPKVLIQSTPLDPQMMRESVRSPQSGAVLVFEGCVRDHYMGKTVIELSYEAYETMALTQLESIRAQAIERYSLNACLIYHRTGMVPPTEAAVVIVCASAHRMESLRAISWILDEIKTRVPIWKREKYMNNEYLWVEAENRFSVDTAPKT